MLCETQFLNISPCQKTAFWDSISKWKFCYLCSRTSGKQKENSKYQEVCHKITRADSNGKIGECFLAVTVFQVLVYCVWIDTRQPAAEWRGVQSGLWTTEFAGDAARCGLARADLCLPGLYLCSLCRITLLTAWAGSASLWELCCPPFWSCTVPKFPWLRADFSLSEAATTAPLCRDLCSALGHAAPSKAGQTDSIPEGHTA